MSYRHGFRHGRSGLVDLTQHQATLPLKVYPSLIFCVNKKIKITVILLESVPDFF